MMRALLDANVLLQTWTVDPLLSLADHAFFEPLWSDRILAEAREHLPEAWGRAPASGVDRYLRLIDAAFPDAKVRGWEALEPSIRLPDPDDRHVLAAAVIGQADVIATWNMKHFPETALAPYGLRVVTPDDLLCELFAIDPEDAMTVMHALVASKRRPPRTMREEIEHLRRIGDERFAAQIEKHTTPDHDCISKRTKRG